jgi:hypothetical protein
MAAIASTGDTAAPPHHRAVEDVAADDAEEQHHDLGGDEQRGRGLDQEWLAMLGAVVAFRRAEHMRMTALVSMMRPSWRPYLPGCGRRSG